MSPPPSRPAEQLRRGDRIVARHGGAGVVTLVERLEGVVLVTVSEGDSPALVHRRTYVVGEQVSLAPPAESTSARPGRRRGGREDRRAEQLPADPADRRSRVAADDDWHPERRPRSTDPTR